MNTELLAAIDARIAQSMAEVAKDTVRLVNIKSVQSAPVPDAPFGEGVKAVLDTFLQMGDAAGLHCTDYHVGVVSAAMHAGEPDLGIWLHGDVVPEGDGWKFPPYDATVYKDCIVGRGTTDNKGQLAAIFQVFKIFDELGIQLHYNPAIFVGSNEETRSADLIGMEGNPDAKGFLNVCTPPRMSLVPDSRFPVGYGGKGSMRIVLRSKTPLHGMTLTAGQDETPGLAVAVLDRSDVPAALPDCTVEKGAQATVSAFSSPRHGANPDPNGNMITMLTGALLDAALVCAEDCPILAFLREVSRDVHGAALGIATHHDVMGDLTVFSKKIDCEDGHPVLTLNIRYPLGITYDQIVQRIEAHAQACGLAVSEAVCGTEPYLLDADNAIVRALCRAVEDVKGERAEPYTLSGSTYAHKLPNAYVFGMEGNLPPEDFPKGRGGAHGIDECVSLKRLEKGMKIYARALLALDELAW